MTDVVVDTNVWAVADEQHSGVCLECVEACQEFLRALGSDRILAVDEAWQILNEYRGNLMAGGFFAKLLSRLQQRGHVRFVGPSRKENDAIFCEGGPLASFDHADRKFVLVALESEPHRPIYNAADPDWSAVSQGLQELGLTIHELCPDDLDGFA